MDITFLNGTPGQQAVVRHTFDLLLHLPLDGFDFEMRYQFVSEATLIDEASLQPGVKIGGVTNDVSSSLALTQLRDSFPAGMSDSTVQDDEIKAAQEAVAHELGHAILHKLAPETQDAVATLFGTTVATWEPQDQGWAVRPEESIAETFKDAFLPQADRLFANRTKIPLPITKYPEFRSLFRTPTQQGSDWTAYPFRNGPFDYGFDPPVLISSNVYNFGHGLASPREATAAGQPGLDCTDSYIAGHPSPDPENRKSPYREYSAGSGQYVPDDDFSFFYTPPPDLAPLRRGIYTFPIRLPAYDEMRPEYIREKVYDTGSASYVETTFPSNLVTDRGTRFNVLLAPSFQFIVSVTTPELGGDLISETILIGDGHFLGAEALTTGYGGAEWHAPNGDWIMEWSANVYTPDGGWDFAPAIEAEMDFGAELEVALDIPEDGAYKIGVSYFLLAGCDLYATDADFGDYVIENLIPDLTLSSAGRAGEPIIIAPGNTAIGDAKRGLRRAQHRRTGRAVK